MKEGKEEEEGWTVKRSNRSCLATLVCKLTHLTVCIQSLQTLTHYLIVQDPSSFSWSERSVDGVVSWSWGGRQLFSHCQKGLSHCHGEEGSIPHCVCVCVCVCDVISVPPCVFHIISFLHHYFHWIMCSSD